MNRITDKNLNDLAKELNLLTGSPVEAVNPRLTEHRHSIGHHFISCQYSSYSLERIVGTDGGTQCQLSGGTKRQLWDEMKAWMAGYRAALAKKQGEIT